MSTTTGRFAGKVAVVAGGGASPSGHCASSRPRSSSGSPSVASSQSTIAARAGPSRANITLPMW